MQTKIVEAIISKKIFGTNMDHVSTRLNETRRNKVYKLWKTMHEKRCIEEGHVMHNLNDDVCCSIMEVKRIIKKSKFDINI